LIIEALSLFTAFCFGLSAVLIRRGMRDSTPMTGAIVGAGVQMVILAVILGRGSFAFDWAAIAFFAASGILSSTLGRITNYLSIQRLGVAVSASIIGSSPLFTALFAILFLGDDVSLPVMLGAILIVGGVVITSFTGGGGRLGGMALLIPVVSAVFYGASSPTLKAGLRVLPEPILGAVVGSAASFLSYLLYLTASRELGQVKITRGCLPYFVGSGVVVSAAWVAMYTAMDLGSVSVVSVIVGANPLFSLLLSWLLLRNEKIGARTVAGCLAIVAGVAVVTLF
jgi:drug/metabolite transporter (DMT)-like permease